MSYLLLDKGYSLFHPWLQLELHLEPILAPLGVTEQVW
jgi:hypothetical protein